MPLVRTYTDGGSPPEVVITWPDYEAEGDGLGAALVDAGCTLRLEPKRGARSAKEVADLMGNAVAAIVSTDPFDSEVFDRCPSLRVVARVGVGVDSVDVNAATRRGVAVSITPGANEGTVADHTLTLMLAVLRRVIEQDGAVRRGEWNRTGSHMTSNLSGSTVGLIGFGRIGRLVAKRLDGFDVRLLACDPLPFNDPAVEPTALTVLLKRSDVVSIHVPLTAGTRRLLGEAELAMMRPNAVLVNTARGEILDERALVVALAAGRIRGAGLDVFEVEPPVSKELLRLPNVVLSSHIAGLSDLSVTEMTRRATASVIAALAGRPSDLANPGVVAHSRWTQLEALR